jgi:hypothetical protein
MNRTTFSTSGFRGARRSASTSSGGAIGNNGRFVSRAQRGRDMRIAFGLAGG